LRETENLVVGLGIAGLNLCHQLEKAGKSFLVIDNCPSNSSSLIASGIYNPVALKRKLKSWMADDFLPVLVETHRELDQKLNTSTLNHKFPILKPVSSNDEITEWSQVIEEGRLNPYVNSIQNERPEGPFTEAVNASVTINNSGFVRLEKLLLAYREHLICNGLLIQEAFEHAEVSFSNRGITYRDIQGDRIIFSEGRFISENPYFNWVPFKPTKGQILTVKTDSYLPPDKIYNNQFLLFPTEEKDVFKLGATYEWEKLDEIPTQQSTDALLTKAEKTLTTKFKVLEEKAAIRPTVIDRRPAIGVHPEIETLFLFNGMGTKGVMIAPYFAKELVGFIYKGEELNPEANLKRFIKKHYKKD
jgi:glycine/D-amino acid oxidase-like deaminating enzyme